MRVIYLDYKLDIDQKSVWLVTNSGNMDNFPYQLCEAGHFYCNKDYYTEREGQKNYFLMYTVSGIGYLKYDEQEIILEPKTAVLIDCTKYQYYKTYGDNWNYKWVHFMGDGVTNYYKIVNNDGINIINLTNYNEFNDNINQIFEHIKKSDIVSNALSAKLITELLTLLITSKFNHKNNFMHKENIERVVEFIENNYNGKINIDDLSAIANISKFYFLKLFKQYIGFTPYEYVLNYRIIKAKEMLRNTNLSVSEIASNVGFVDCSHFIKQFKKTTSITPFVYKLNN